MAPPTDEEIQSWYYREIDAQERRIVYSLDVIEEYRYSVDLLRQDLALMEQKLAWLECHQ